MSGRPFHPVCSKRCWAAVTLTSLSGGASSKTTQEGNSRIPEAGSTWSAQCSSQKHNNWRGTLQTRSILFQISTPPLRSKELTWSWNYRTAWTKHSLEVWVCLTWLDIRVLKSIQPIEAEDLVSIGSHHQWKFAGIDLHLHLSLAGIISLLLTPWVSDPAGAGQGQRQDFKTESEKNPYISYSSKKSKENLR